MKTMKNGTGVCGRDEHETIKRARWGALPLVGSTFQPADEYGPAAVYEHRNCDVPGCGSTLVVERAA